MFQRLALSRRAVIGLVLAAALPVLAGCGLEAKDYTSKEHATVQGASNHIAAIDIRDVFITSDADLSGTIKTYLVATLVNNSKSADSLTGVTTSLGPATIGGAGAATGTVTLPPSTVSPVQLSDPSIDSTAPTITIQTTNQPTVGTTAQVTFDFAVAGQSPQLAVPVIAGGESLSPERAVPYGQATPPVETEPSASD